MYECNHLYIDSKNDRGEIMKDSCINQIYELMKKEPECTIFIVNDFVDRFDEEVVRKSLTRLANDGKITRLMKGYFTIPYYISSVDEYGYPSAQEMAEKIAERYGWNIIPIKETVLNYLGLSTQVPYITEYISTGPYREINYSNSTIKFHHTDQLQLLQCSKPLSMVLQAIREIGKNQMTQLEFSKLCSYCKKNVNEDLYKASKIAPAWIRKVLKQIAKENKCEEIPATRQKRSDLSIS